MRSALSCTKTLAIGAGLLCLAPLARAGVGTPLVASGGEITVTVLPFEALFTNVLYLSNPVGEFGPHLVATNRDVGQSFTLGTFAPGTELVLRIEVQDTGDEYFSGAAWRNADGIAHATVGMTDRGTALVGFEDLWEGGDKDYDDAVFEFSNAVPAPGTLALAGLGVAMLARRRR